MQFINAVFAVLGFVAVAQAADLTFYNKDRYDLIACFIPAPGHGEHPGVYVPAGQYRDSPMEYDWHGAVFTIFPGEDAIYKYYTAGTVIAEFVYHGDYGLMYYDISAIHAPYYNDGVHRIWPQNINGDNVGCYRFPCDEAYLPWDDIHARKSHSTPDENLVLQIGLENRDFAKNGASDSDPAPELLIPKKSYPGLPADPALTEILARHLNQTKPN